MIAFFIGVLLQLALVAAIPIGSCDPIACPAGYNDEGISCSNGVCTRICSIGECGTTPTRVYTGSVYLPDENTPSGFDDQYYAVEIGSYTPTDTNKCYKFTQTTPDNFIEDSDVDHYDDTSNFDAISAFYWETDSSKWYGNQNRYCSGEDNFFLSDQTGAVWIDSCGDGGDNFNSADNFEETNEMYCAPSDSACFSFNGNSCDTGCYGHETTLWLYFDAHAEHDFNCNSFNSFCTVDVGEDPNGASIEIDYINFLDETVYFYVDGYDLVGVSNDNQECTYWPECNPANPCCDEDGYFRGSGYVCNPAHDAQCTSAFSCSGTAYEDRCVNNDDACPDNNYVITHDAACDDLICDSDSCASGVYEPIQTCSAGACQQNDPYVCPFGLACDGSTCKTSASSSSDCQSGYTYNSQLDVCLPSGVSGEEFVYDANGNRISDGRFLYAYNNFNQLESISDLSGTLLESYTYDHEGNRVKKEDHTTGDIVYYADKYVETVTSSGTFDESYYIFNNQIIAKKDHNGDVLYFHNDHLGSPRLVTDQNGNTVATFDYHPYGFVNNSDERYLYTGQELDDTDLYYFGARYYDPSVRSFLQVDPVLQVYDPQALNRYAYVLNNPYLYVDANGEFAVEYQFGATGGIGRTSGELLRGIYITVDEDTNTIQIGTTKRHSLETDLSLKRGFKAHFNFPLGGTVYDDVETPSELRSFTATSISGDFSSSATGVAVEVHFDSDFQNVARSYYFAPGIGRGFSYETTSIDYVSEPFFTFQLPPISEPANDYSLTPETFVIDHSSIPIRRGSDYIFEHD